MTTTSSEVKEIKKEVVEPQVENQPKEKKSFFQRHKKKIFGTVAALGLVAGITYLCTRSSKSANPSQETAESKEESAQINKEEQTRGDREDRRNNRNGGNSRQQW